VPLHVGDEVPGLPLILDPIERPGRDPELYDEVVGGGPRAPPRPAYPTIDAGENGFVVALERDAW